MVTNLFGLSQVEVISLAQDLHYQLRDPQSGGAVASVAPVAVGTVPEEKKEKGLRRFLRGAKPSGPLPGEGVHIPRVTFRVAAQETIFFLDRPDKLPGHGFMPHYAVVDAGGGVIGYTSNDHRRALDPPSGPVDDEGMTLISGRGALLDRDHQVVCETVVRAAMNPGATGEPGVRFVGRDGAPLARMRGHDSTRVEFAPQAPQLVRALVTALMIAGRVDERLQVSILTSGYSPPAPVGQAGEPYPGYAQVHSSYMRYQEEFIEWYKAEQNRRGRIASAGAS
ncbi:hypothetical protein [Spirillospora sp. NPDC047279]|uniref:hypothetical protein n=1 Tax=Spirillospora sp. NPDC047279 TaxID=3155478 RepID=UPI00340DD967